MRRFYNSVKAVEWCLLRHACGPDLESISNKRAARTQHGRESASLLVDLGNTCILQPSLLSLNNSGAYYSSSGVQVGLSCNLGNANSLCNLVVAGVPWGASGILQQLSIAVQCADSDTSGSYTDPTSGLATFPAPFISGGIIVLNSGASGGLFNPIPISGQYFTSGFMVAAGFQRPQTYARVVGLSGGFYAGSLFAGFVTQLRTVGSGGGMSQSPGSGVPSV
jgi:hypothetical protein